MRSVHRNHISLRIYQSRWHILATFFLIAIPFLALLGFAQVAQVARTQLLSDVFLSVGRLMLASLIAAVLGWLCAVLFYRGRRASVALPLFDVLQSFPTYAALPLATLAWGPSNFTVIFFLVLAVVWPIFFSVTSSLKLIRRDWQEAVAMSGLRGFSSVRRFLLPASIPGLITGIVIGLGDGWEALVATEIIVKVRGGLGGFFESFSGNPRITVFGIFALLLLIFSINKLIWLPLLEWSHRTMEE